MIYYLLYIMLLSTPEPKPAKCDIFKAKDYWLSPSRERLVCRVLPTVVKESQKHNLDPDLVLALITVESNWKREAVSPADACGLTQVIPKYTGQITKRYSCDQLKNPYVSIKAGTKILKWWIDYHKGDVTRGLCGYNAGFRCGIKRKKPSKGGMRYAKKVLTQKQNIKRDYNELVNSLR